MTDFIQRYVPAMILGAASGSNLAAGLDKIVSHYSKIDSVRDAVFAHADKITPQVIEQANDLVSKVGDGDLYRAAFNLGVAGLTGAASYVFARGQSK